MVPSSQLWTPSSCSVPPSESQNQTDETPFIGRAEPLRQVESRLRELRNGDTSLALITGEPGVGKTSLAREVTLRAGESAGVVWVRCWPDEGGPAFVPWSDVVAQLLDPAGPALDAAHASRLAGLPGGASSSEPSASPSLRDRAHALREAIDDRGPTILVLDDLHTADRPSIELLARMAQTTGRSGLLLLATARTQEIETDPTRREAFGTLLRVAHHVPLAGFDAEEMATFCESRRSGLRPGREELDSLAASTGGIPFLLEEALRGANSETSLDEVATRLSLGSRLFLQGRLDSLSPEARTLAGFLAVYGSRFSATVVSDHLPGRETKALEGLGEMTDLGILVRDGGGSTQYRFAHDLYRETLRDELSNETRHALHLEIAEGLIATARKTVGNATTIAHHLREAQPLGDVAVAGQWARRAADACMDAPSAPQAIAWLELAIDCDRRERRSPEAPSALLQQLARAHSLAGDDDAAERLLVELIDQAAGTGDPTQTAQATLLLAEIRPARGSTDLGLVGLVEDALAGLGRRSPRLRAGLLARLSTALYFEDLKRSRKLADQGLQLARSIDEPLTLCNALASARTAHWGPDQPELQLDLSRELLATARNVRDDVYLRTAFHWLATDLLRRGARLELDDLLRGWRKDATGAVDRRPMILLEFLETTRDLTAGRLDEAEKRSERLQRELEGFPASSWSENLLQFAGVQLFAIARERGRLQSLEPGVRGFAEQYPNLRIWRSGLAVLLAETGRAEEAFQELESLGENDFQSLPRDGNWVATVANCAEVAGRTRATRHARQLHALLEPLKEFHVVIGMGAASWGSVHHFLGVLEEALGDADAAVKSFQRAIAANQAAGAFGLAAYDDIHLASLLGRQPETLARAREILSESEDVASRMGSVRLTQWIETVRARLDDEETTPARSPARASRRALFRREGQLWVVGVDGAQSRLRHRRGLSQLWRLLSSPGVDFLAFDLVNEIDSTSTGQEPRATQARTGPLETADELLDDRARAEIRARLQALQEQRQEAETIRDHGRAEALRSEEESLLEALRRATGLGGRSRRTSSAAERARINVTRTLRGAIRTIGDEVPTLGAYLDRHIETGRTCRYEPDPVAPLHFDLD